MSLILHKKKISIAPFLFSLLASSLVICSAFIQKTHPLCLAPISKPWLHNKHTAFAKGENDDEDIDPPPETETTPVNTLIEYETQSPNPEIASEKIVPICMDALQRNNEPFINAGLETCFNFSSDACRAALGGNLEAFIRYANNPTFGSLIDCQGYKIVSVGPEIPGTQTRGAMQTMLIDVTTKKGQERRFLWTLQRERRPPRAGCWLVHEVMFTDNAYSLTL